MICGGFRQGIAKGRAAHVQTMAAPFEAVADFFIICEASNQPQVRAISEHIEQQVKDNCDEIVYHHEGYQSLHWVLIDYVNVVVHVMLSETRKFYKLEEMWSDGEESE
ncbi:MAG: ribosome silencing factor [Sphingobacteriales bacterium 12-47-4]|nr:MAG: ribosome silencing factor [Sphingobacteriales bacterium 12-47-4]